MRKHKYNLLGFLFLPLSCNLGPSTNIWGSKRAWSSTCKQPCQLSNSSEQRKNTQIGHFLWQKWYSLPGSDSADCKCCLFEVIRGMVEELGSCCGLCVTDMDRARTSQVPELGSLCQPANPAAGPRACWQRKFPELSTCNVTLITQREEQKGACWSRLLSGAICLSLPASLSDSLFLLSACLNKTSPTEDKHEGVNPLDSSCPQGLTRLSEPARDGWDEGGCRGNSPATLPPARVPRGKRRQRLSRSHQGLFSPCCPAELVPLEHANGFDGGHVTKSAWCKQQQTGYVKSWGVIFTPLMDLFRHSRHS